MGVNLTRGHLPLQLAHGVRRRRGGGGQMGGGETEIEERGWGEEAARSEPALLQEALMSVLWNPGEARAQSPVSSRRAVTALRSRPAAVSHARTVHWICPNLAGRDDIAPALTDNADVSLCAHFQAVWLVRWRSVEVLMRR